MDGEALAAALVKRCLDKGADQAEVYLETRRNFSVEIRNGEVETVERADTHGVGFRVFVRGRMAFASSNDLSNQALDRAVETAVGFAGNTTPDENNVLPDDRESSEVPGLYDPELEGIPVEAKMELARRAEKLAMRDSRITKSAGARYAEGEGEVFLANSNGLSKRFRETFCSYGVSVVAEKGEQKSSGSEFCSRRFFKDLKPPEEVADKAAREAYEMLDPRMVKTQKAAVVFDPDAARAVLGGILAAVNGERVLQGASFLAVRMNQKIASERVTIIDDGTRPRGLASRPFDGEGVPTRKRVIVEKGILKGFLYNTIAARRAGVESTGNASRRGFASLPGIGAHNFYMEAGEDAVGDIIRATENGLYLKGVTGYGIIPVNGNFSGGAAGFWIKDGKKTFPVKGLTVAGTALDMLRSIDMVAGDLDLNRNLAAPTFRIASLQIGGE